MKAENIKEENKKASKIRKQLNEGWQTMERSRKYRRARDFETYRSTTQKIEAEVMDGIFLNLSERNCDKSFNVQMRLLRRIVEKRQAQANHAKNGRSADRKTNAVNTTLTRRSLAHLRRLRQAL